MKNLFFKHNPRSNRYLYRIDTPKHHSESPENEAVKPEVSKELNQLKYSVQKETLERVAKTEKQPTTPEVVSEKTEIPEVESASNEDYKTYATQLRQQTKSAESFSLSSFENELPPGFAIDQFPSEQFA